MCVDHVPPVSIPATAAMDVMIIRITTKTSDNFLIVYSIFYKLCVDTSTGAVMCQQKRREGLVKIRAYGDLGQNGRAFSIRSKEEFVCRPSLNAL